MSRRQFVAAAAAPVLLAACGRRAFDRRQFPRLDRSPVALLPAASYRVDLADLIGAGLRELRVDVRGRRVLLKPNVVEYEADSVINTSPLVVAGAAVAMKRAGAAEVVVAEGPGHRRDTEYLLTRTGLYDQLRDLRIRFVDLNLDDVRDVNLATRFMGLDRLALPVELLRADFIVSMPKLKTHHWAMMTGSMKNFFGVVPGAVYGWPKNILHMHGIDNSIVDLNATIRPHLTIMDAVNAMEGDGPIMGSARHLGFVALGTDLPAVDATCARIIGLDPSKVPYLKMAGEFLGNIELSRIEQRGERLARYATSFDIPDRFAASRLQRMA